jgi:SAM-dependent methyltransferase
MTHEVRLGFNPVAVFGQIDIYLFDQILRGRIAPRDRVFDAGCGMGRNLAFLLRAGCDVAGADADADAIAEVRALAASLRPDLPPSNFQVEPLEALTIEDAWADVVISSAVLHFARDEAQFGAMLHGSWRVLRPGGMFFCRLASSIGIESRITPEDAGRGGPSSPTAGVVPVPDRAKSDALRPDPTVGCFRLPDGTTRFLVNEERLMRWTEEIGGDLLDPLKTTVVQDQRSMTTWVVRKR